MKKNRNYIILLVLITILFASSTVFAWRPVATRQRACFSNQRVFLGALEMRAMDDGQVITDIKPEDWDKVENELVAQKYLRSKQSKPNVKCVYGMTSEFCPYPEGDPHRYGYIYCTYHGTPEKECKKYYGICKDDYDPYQMSPKERMFLRIKIVALLLILTIVYFVVRAAKKSNTKENQS